MLQEQHPPPRTSAVQFAWMTVFCTDPPLLGAAKRVRGYTWTQAGLVAGWV
jgi:hypothetical protein